MLLTIVGLSEDMNCRELEGFGMFSPMVASRML